MHEVALGQSLYATLERPTSGDERWMGMCCLALADRERALEHALRALAMGEARASIDLVRLYLLIGKPEQMQAEMAMVQVEQLDRLNRAIWHRNVSVVHALHNNIHDAVLEAEKAWRVIQTAPEFNFYAPEVLVTCSGLLATSGRVEQALYYLGRADEICQTPYLWHIKMTRIVLALDHMVLQGVIEDAQLVIQNTTNTKILVVSHMSIARTHLCLGRLAEAQPYFEQALLFAQKAVMHDFIHMNQEYLFLVFQRLGLHHKARRMFKRMQLHIGADLHGSFVDVHRSYMDDRFTQEEATALVDQALNFVREYGDDLEIMRVLMYRCRMLLRHSPANFSNGVDDLATFITEQDCAHKCFEDWVFLPEVRKDLDTRYPGLIPTLDENQVQVLTLEQERILFNGEDVRLPLSKAMEVVVYLLLHGKVSLQNIISHVFQDLEPQKARNYFHQIKHQLSENVGLFQIVYDKNTRLYSIESGHPIMLDIKQLLESQQKTDQVFLPSSGSDWVLEMNARLQN
ncbi:hypothetical protein [Deinococcus roseus]|nr:hypothetical protein [Deinococcus roseus]